MSYITRVLLFILAWVSTLIRRRLRFFTVVLCTTVMLSLTGLLYQNYEKVSKDVLYKTNLASHLVRKPADPYNADIDTGGEKKLQTYLQQLSAKKNRVRRLGNGSICKLPVLDPFHKSVQNLITRYPPLDCGKLHSTFENNTLRVKADNVVAVTYRIINRPHGDDFRASMSESFIVTNSKQDAMHSKNVSHEVKSGNTFDGTAKVNADFVRVDITRSAGKESITEVHMQAAPKPEVLKRKVQPAGIPVNIAMIMFDSTSAANFVRQMPITRKYLKTRPTVYLKGETIVGDGTTAQLCAMLTGIPEVDQPEARRSKPNAKVVDDWRWVFRDYKKRGYVTMYSEDAPNVATFNYRLLGFRDPPTDHYGRPFWFEADSHSHKEHCSTNQPIHKVTMKYFLSMFRSYQNNPKFAFLLFSDLTHGHMNALKYADQDLTDLLKTMDRESHLDDTIVFIFGDHGSRYGGLRKTLQGKLEERLPHMSITFPTWFPKKHPQLYKNVQRNAKLLTSPFDIYATLQHILSYPELPNPKEIVFGQSIFVPIDPQSRTCARAGVEEHWCPCLDLESVPVDSSTVKQAVNFTMNFMNNLIEKEEKSKRLCQKLSLKEIKTAFFELPNEKVQTFKNTLKNNRCDSCIIVLGEKDENTLIEDTLYQIQFITSPNDGFYEASVKFKGGVPSIKGAISRVDTFGDQPRCIQDTHVHLIKFCYCKP